MSVLLVTSVGDIVVDLFTDRCPLTTKNFLKLCKMKYYNGCLFHKVEKDFMAQTGDRTGTGSGGDSLYKFLYGDQARFFDDEIHPDLKHAKTGTIAMASAGENLNASQFYFTLRDELDYLDGKHTVFGVVEEKEGLDTLTKINEAYADDKGRPFKDIRIKHTYILDDPFDDPPQLAELIPERSPEGKSHDETAEERLEDNWVPLDETLGVGELDEAIRSKEAHTNAAILESIGDIPDLDAKPPENVLFVCKLNPVTQDEDLYTIFSRFGDVSSADIIRDYKTGDSLCYAFIEFETKEACERAYFKMDNTLIDDRRIHVDFSQSVAKLWGQYRHGKRTNTSKGACFKCGATDHFARDCNQDSDSKPKGPTYVLKNDDIQHGGDDQQKYEMLFDEENLESSEGHERPKRQKAGHRDHDQKRPGSYGHVDNERRGSRDDNGNQGSRKSEEYRRDKEERDAERYDDKEHRRRHESTRHRDDRDDYRSLGSSRHGKEGPLNERHKRHKVDDRRGEDSERTRRDVGYGKGNEDNGSYKRSSQSSRHGKEGSEDERHKRHEVDHKMGRDSERTRRDDGYGKRKTKGSR